MGTWGPHVVSVAIAIVIQSCIVYSQRATKSSLTFVIDDSQSMTDEIEQVRDSVDSIFDTVMSSNQSQIQNFVLVSFNDGTEREPDYILHAATEDRATFKAAAARVHIRDGVPECPERAMLGIKIGIQNSLPMSTLYVFTDASAKDYQMYNEIKAMAHRKQIQVTFLLTDDCGSRGDTKYQVYHHLAAATNGEVFNLKKRDIKDILKYVRENTKSRGDFITSKRFPAGYGFQFNFTVDSRTKDFTMSIAGIKPKLEIIDPYGNAAITEPMVEKDEILIVKVTNTTPGLYKAKVGSEAGTLAKVTGESDIHFEYGFSKLEPTSLSVTATRPEADGKTYLSIQLFGEGVRLKTAKILDLKDKVLNELPLRLLDNKTQFYATEQFEPPKTMFRVFVYGYDDDNNMNLSRTAGNPTNVRDLNEKVEDVAPEVTIIEGNKVILDYDSTLRVTCKVHAHPRPEITWRDKDTGEIKPANVTEVAPPYDFISSLNIEKSNKNANYECKAKNSLGENESHVVVEANIYFKVLETPNNTTSIEYDKEGSVSCVVDASSPATTIWYKDGRPLSNGTNLVIASDNTTLTIKHMDLESVGTYVCEVQNQLQRRVFNSEVDVFGLEKPVIEKTEDEINVIKGDDTELSCRITQGVPKPKIQWYYQPQEGDSVQTMSETSDTLQLKLVTADSNGNYTCNATNLVGSDTHTIELIVEYAPTIQTDGSDKIQPEQGDAVTVPCDVDGVPLPIVKWLKNDVPLDSTVDINITSNNSLKFHTIMISDSGLYTCQAENQYGSANKTVSVNVTAKPIIDKTNNIILVTKGDDSQLTCRITQGTPKPIIRWYYQSQAGDSVQTLSETNDTLQLKLVTADSNGKYTCNATNLVGSDTYTFELVVEYAPTINTDGSNKIQPERGDAVTVPCDVDGVPPPTVTWFKNGTPLVSTVDIEITSSNSLKFHAIMLTDSGLYTCSAENRHGSGNKTVSVDVTEKPVIDKTIKKILLTKGDNSQLACRITQGTPKPTIRWYYQSEAGDSVQTLSETNDTLQLKLTTVDSNGKYTCNATNLVGSDTHTFEFIVEYAPTINTDGTNKIQPERGDSVTVSCDVDGVPPPTVTWFKNGTPLVSTVNIEITSSNSLKFHTITLTDSGLYTCSAENRHGSGNKTVSVDVTEKPVIDKTNKKILVTKGDNSQLACRITQGTPKPTIRWYYQSQAGDSVQTLSETNDTLQLKLVTADSNGTYTCNATNLVGSDTYTFELVVEYAPTINTDGTYKIQPERGDSVTVSCDVDGVPPPTVTWFKNGTPLVSTVNIEITSSNSLKFHAIVLTDSGLYTCSAENRHGSGNKTVSVDVTEKPVIDKTIKKILVTKGDNSQLACRITQGTPKPTIRWYYQSEAGDSVQTLSETNDTLQLKLTTVDSNGKYTCNATNLVGSDTHTFEFVVEYAPTINTDGTNKIQPERGDSVTVPCDVDGVPLPIVSWFKNGTPLVSTVNIEITSSNSLKFHTITLTDSGLYTCSAENRHGSGNKTVSVDVTEKPVIDKTNKKILVTKGDNSQLACRITQGTPKPTIRWYYQSQAGDSVQTLSETNDTLQLKLVTADSNGKYTCNATNLVGSDTYTFELVVEYAPTINTDGTNKIQPERGDSVTVSCDVDGVPPPTVTWFKNGTPLVSTVNIEIPSSNSLKFHAIVLTDSGLYTCSAENRHGSGNKTVYVDVTEKPVIDKTFKKILVTKGDNSQLACRITQGTPKPTIRWYYQSEAGDSVQTLSETNDTLQLKLTTVDSNGKYTCNATNLVGSDTHTFEFVVEYAPTINTDGTNKIQPERGDSVTVSCDVDGVPPPTVTWFKNGTPLVSTVNIEITSSNSLKFHTITLTDSGLYTCSAENRHGSGNKTVSVDVTEKPVIDKTNKKILVTKGDNSQLACRITQGTPKPTIRWYYQSQAGDSVQTLSETNDTLQLKLVTADSNGKYTCNATNLVGSDTYTFELVVEYAPTINTDGTNKIQPERGDSITVSCDVDGVPPPTVTWFKNGTPLVSTVNIEITSSNSLKFHTITLTDSGLYTCSAENRHGSGNKTVSVDVTEKPIIDKTNKKILVRKGDNSQLACRITQGTPKPTIRWYYQSQVGDSVQTLSETNDTLQLELVTVDSNGKYTCNATNLLGSDTYTFELVVEYVPTINTDGFNKIQPERGDAVTVPCDVDGVPPPTVTWFKNGTPLVSTVDIEITSSNSLKFHAIMLTDSGLYTCQAENRHGSGNKTVSVDVTEKPIIDKTNKKILVTKGDNSQLTCRITQGTPRPTIQWYYQPQVGDSVQTLADTSEILQLKLVTVDSNGKYTCNATNLVGSDIYTVELIVEFGPQIETITVTNITRVLNQRLNLKCLVSGNPRPDIVWIHTDFHGVTKPTKILYLDHGQYLFTEKVRLTDEGYYTCVASNSGGSANITYEVNVYAKPIIDKTDYEKRVRKGEDVQISCPVIQGNPKPTIQWYFQSKDSKYLLNLNETGENLLLPSVTADKSGTYQCNASNVEGFDLQVIEFIVECPPEIKDDDNKTIIANHNDILIIPCDVDGIPSPSVKWFKNGYQLNNTRQTAIMGNHSLKIIAISVSSIDTYTCVAENHLGSRNKTVFVNVYVVPSIEVPLDTNIEKNVGEYLILPCRADGYPMPNLTWIYYNVTGIKEEKLLKYDETAMVMGLENIQVNDSGYYKCEARNDAGPSSLMYTVTVNAPPVIVDVYPEKTIKTVKGDLVLRVPCEVTGSPKPTLTWKKNNFNVSLDSSNYDVKEGTLIIKNIDKISEGNYECVAENKAGKANVSYDVIVTDYPDLDPPVSRKFIEEGQDVSIACDIRHNKYDLLRWYKDGYLINEGELTLINTQEQDNGVYSCRVSNSTKSSSAHVNITVGYKPYFTSEEKLYHKFVKDDIVGLSCSAEGSPTPKVSWWLNGDNLIKTSMFYEVIMRFDNRGNYTCEVSNELGNIQRSFTIAAEGCILDGKKDFLDNKQPLMLSSSLKWPIFYVTEGFMILRKNDIFKLHCPTGFNKFHTKFVEARCENETNVKINGKVYKYAEIECKTEVEPTVHIVRGGCLAGHDTTYVQVGYDVDGRFFKVYDVCLDNEDQVPLYTQHVINKAQYGVTKNVDNWFGHIMLPLDFDIIYDCVTQVEDISTTLGKPFHPYDKCCYDKRQLVNTKDLRPGIPPAVAYSYLNVVPHWSTCNSKNWADVEQKVRDLAKSRPNELVISTGTAEPSRMSTSVYSSGIMLNDKRGRTQPIAQYIWKVVQDPVSKSSLAIIQINIPDISRAEARKYVHCRDICDSVGWMTNSNWHNVKDGYTYCCSISEFESEFNYNGQFSGDMTNILSDWGYDGIDYS